MLTKKRILCTAAVALFAIAAASRAVASPPAQSGTGILLLAHGGSPAWNENVRALAASLDRDQPVEVAFGMATRASIQHSVDALVARGVERIVAVPLFVSSHSSVVTSTEYLLGLRQDAPADLAKFAKMSHGSHAAPAAAAAPHQHEASPEDGTRPIVSRVPIRMTRALDSHPAVAAILADRARSISKNPAHEAVILVAHGPVNETENGQWLDNMRELAKGIAQDTAYSSIDSITVRDDAPPAIREAATVELRTLVDKRRSGGSKVLVVPGTCCRSAASSRGSANGWTASTTRWPTRRSCPTID